MAKKKQCTATLEVKFPDYLTPDGSCAYPGDPPNDTYMFRVDWTGSCSGCQVYDVVMYIDAEGNSVTGGGFHDFDSDWHNL